MWKLVPFCSQMESSKVGEHLPHCPASLNHECSNSCQWNRHLHLLCCTLSLLNYSHKMTQVISSSPKYSILHFIQNWWTCVLLHGDIQKWHFLAPVFLCVQALNFFCGKGSVTWDKSPTYLPWSELNLINLSQWLPSLGHCRIPLLALSHPHACMILFQTSPTRICDNIAWSQERLCFPTVWHFVHLPGGIHLTTWVCLPLDTRRTSVSFNNIRESKQMKTESEGSDNFTVIGLQAGSAAAGWLLYKLQEWIGGAHRVLKS